MGASDDPYEIEADEVAEKVLLEDQDGAPRTGALLIQSLPAMQGSANPVPARVSQVLSQPGMPLDATLRADMERRFGHDFSRVRIHVGPDAGQSAREVNALAYTVGSRIVFGAGQFDPASRAGRRLLAHELTHVVQQTTPMPSATAHVQRDTADDQKPFIPAPITRDEASLQYTTSYFQTLIRNQIQWHLSRVLPFELYLLVTTTGEERALWTPSTIAEKSAAVFAATADLNFKTGPGGLAVILESGLAKSFENPSPKIQANLVPVSFEQMREQFDGREFVTWWAAAMRNADHETLWPLVAESGLSSEYGSTPSKDKGTATNDLKKSTDRKPDPWVEQQLAAVKELLKRPRTDDSRTPRDLPDKIVPWFNGRDNSWYVNVWVNFDAQGKDKTGNALKLREGEPPANLLERLSDATDKAVDQYRTQEDRRREKAMPSWAVELKAHLDARLHQVTGGKKLVDSPDGTTLRWSDEATLTRGPDLSTEDEAAADTAQRKEQVLLAIWVVIGEKRPQRQYGSVPINPQTPLEPLLAYVRRLAAILREHEATPDVTADDPLDINIDPALEPFEAKILPIDLAWNHITVAGAANEYSMFLDFDKRYQAIGADPLYVASKLYSQPIAFHWRVYDVSGVTTPSKKTDADQAWGERWKALYEIYNPRGMIGDGEFVATAPRKGDPELTLGDPISSSRGDITSRVELPDRPGDFLIACITASAPVGDAKLQRPSARAFFPVRTVSKETLGDPLVTTRNAEIESSDLDLKALDSALAAENLDDDRRQLLRLARNSTEKRRHIIESHETSGLAQSTGAEITDGEDKLRIVQELKTVLPAVIAQARANKTSGDGPSTPSKLLADRPQLLFVYWQLLHEGKSVTDYEKEVQQQLEELKKLHERAVVFQHDMKSDPDSCLYNPEAVFISKLDGHTYPLLLIVGESRTSNGFGVAYTVADVTTEQTKGRYSGESLQQGSVGHIEAIDRAFEDFGEHATYGEGWIAVRIPQGTREACNDLHRSGIKYYPSKEGITERAWRYLGYLAAAVSVAALAASGVGAPAAAAILGALAAGLGAVTAIHNIQERSRKHTLAVDAELGMDALAILGAGELVAIGTAGRLTNAVRGFENVERLGRFMAVYRGATHGAAAILIPVKLVQDVKKIKDLHLPKDQEDAMITEAYAGAVEGGIMFLGASLGSRGSGGEAHTSETSIREQADLLSLEGEQYRSFEDKGWVDESGNWTDQAPDSVRRKLAAGFSDEEATAPRRQDPDGQTPAHPGAEVPEPKVSPEQQAAADKAVDRVNRHEAIVTEDAEGNRHADVGNEHQIEEVEEPDGSVDCLYHSAIGVPVSCPIGMGGHQEPKSPAGPDAESSSAETTDKLPPAEAAGAHIAKNLRPTPASAVDMVELNIPVEAPQKLGSRLSKAKLAKDQDALYVLRNEHGAVLKVGKTSEKAIKGRFSVYKRAGKLTDIDVQVEVYPLDMKALATSGKTAEAYEAILRASMEGQESMPWDNTGGRLGRPGFGTPGEGIRKSPITLGEMRELLEWYKGNKAKIGEELGVHARTVDLWAKSLGLIPKDFKPGK